MTPPRLHAIYLCVQDMDRAVVFYEQFLQQKVDKHDPRMSSFKLGTIELLLFYPPADEETCTRGNNVIPNFKVDDIHHMRQQLQPQCPVVIPLSTFNGYDVFQVEDTEGNVIECYQLQQMK